MLRVLFVCTGNLCRSPMAQFLLLDRLAERGVEDVIVLSAGFIAQEGAPACPMAVEITGRIGVDMSRHKAKVLSRDLLEWADKVLVMEKRHLKLARMMAPEAEGKMALFSDYVVGKQDMDVPDPYGETEPEYIRALDIIRKGVNALAEEIAGNKPGTTQIA
ncbi:MAG: low molecular weight phosphotyrosine protein phosphatase [Nitrospinota bacterium]|nr:low molecular weight phosphotyrosine protein phosphatase [Nitrospinota bacterium]